MSYFLKAGLIEREKATIQSHNIFVYIYIFGEKLNIYKNSKNMTDKKKVVCLIEQEKEKSRLYPSDIHICYMCQRNFRCKDAKEAPGQKERSGCLCDLVFIVCPCPKCSDPQSKVKGIAAIVCKDNCEDADYDTDDDYNTDVDHDYDFLYRY